MVLSIQPAHPHFHLTPLCCLHFRPAAGLLHQPELGWQPAGVSHVPCHAGGAGHRRWVNLGWVGGWLFESTCVLQVGKSVAAACFIALLLCCILHARRRYLTMLLADDAARCRRRTWSTTTACLC